MNEAWVKQGSEYGRGVRNRVSEPVSEVGCDLQGVRQE